MASDMCMLVLTPHEPTQIMMVAGRLKIESFAPHKMVCEQGEIGTKYYIVLRGAVNIYKVCSSQSLNVVGVVMPCVRVIA